MLPLEIISVGDISASSLTGKNIRVPPPQIKDFPLLGESLFSNLVSE